MGLETIPAYILDYLGQHVNNLKIYNLGQYEFLYLSYEDWRKISNKPDDPSLHGLSWLLICNNSRILLDTSDDVFFLPFVSFRNVDHAKLEPLLDQYQELLVELFPKISEEKFERLYPELEGKILKVLQARAYV